MRQFTSAPVLKHSDPRLQFMIEVGTSDSGVGAVLSQHDVLFRELHPWAFFLRRLSQSERNDDVVNRELQWRHWLEGSQQPFITWTNNKSPPYLSSAIWLNSRQAHWSLYLSWFNYTLFYCPGSWNGKSDALYWLYSLNSSPSDPEPIMPSPRIVGLAIWEIETLVREAQQFTPDPGSGPNNRLFVPETVCSRVLQWEHSSKLTCNPGDQRTQLLLHQHFWWPELMKDVKEFVAACMGFARSKALHRWSPVHSSTVAFSLPLSYSALTGDEPRKQLLYESLPAQLLKILIPSQ